MKSAPDSLQRGQDLCLSCGLCCDGTIFSTVEIDNPETIQRYKSAGIDFDIANEVTDGKQRFRQPCAAFAAGCCKIYPDRPLVCRNFKCDLLKAYMENEIDFFAASEIVKKVKDRKSDILRRITELDLPLKSTNIVFDLYDQAFEFFKNLEEGERKRQCGEIVLQIAALRLYISANFRNFETMEKDMKSKPENSNA
jgi:Fe-S-cluster containining protein